MNANDLFKAVTELNLDPIKMKLMHVESGEGWSLEKANAVEKEYRRFLCLMKLFPEEDTAPLVDVDTFWHYHILDTMKYATDCEKVFGYFLHHYPYVGLDGTAEDEQFRLDSGERMRELYENIFGEAYPATEATGITKAAQVETCTIQRHTVSAWCASPGNKKVTADGASATAWCASPGNKKVTADGASATAWCASPGNKKVTAKGASATVWCASPGNKKVTANGASATAWCASPGNKKVTANGASATAWCASPGQPTRAAGVPA